MLVLMLVQTYEFHLQKHFAGAKDDDDDDDDEAGAPPPVVSVSVQQVVEL